MRIDGMHCGACVRRVSQALAAEGLTVKEVGVGVARVEPDAAAADRAIAAIEKAGYRAHLDAASASQTVQTGQ